MLQEAFGNLIHLRYDNKCLIVQEEMDNGNSRNQFKYNT